MSHNKCQLLYYVILLDAYTMKEANKNFQTASYVFLVVGF